MLELFHGPTQAFKDIALQLLPSLMKEASRITGEGRMPVILTATSGDTGMAALAAFSGSVSARIAVFYPAKGVSAVQRLQMVTCPGDNALVCGILGDFDDAQRAVKAIFGDRSVDARLSDHGFLLSSANSINWGRLAPQIVYYVYAWAEAVRTGLTVPFEPVRFCVPSGNFGNILAGFYAGRMGIPIRTLLCASNANRVLADFLSTGTYEADRGLVETMSPAMDIIVASNLERLLFEVSGRDAQLVRGLMSELATSGSYKIPESLFSGVSKVFSAGWASEEETTDEIARVFTDERVAIDPHTAVACVVERRFAESAEEGVPCILMSTASPFKFPRAVLSAIAPQLVEEYASDLEMMLPLAAVSGVEVPENLSGLRKREIVHTGVVGKDDVEETLCRFLGIDRGGSGTIWDE